MERGLECLSVYDYVYAGKSFVSAGLDCEIGAVREGCVKRELTVFITVSSIEDIFFGESMTICPFLTFLPK